MHGPARICHIRHDTASSIVALSWDLDPAELIQVSFVFPHVLSENAKIMDASCRVATTRPVCRSEQLFLATFVRVRLAYRLRLDYVVAQADGLLSRGDLF